jgi:hypothetical protein
VKRALVIVALVALHSGAHADAPSYARDRRVAYIDRALGALRSMAPAATTALEDALQAGARSQCKAAYGRPPVNCLVQVAQSHCEARPPGERISCHLVADVALANLLGESELIDDKTRIGLMNESGGFRAAMRAELRRRYATLAAEMALTTTHAAAAEQIDAFCAGTRRTLPWQRCAAAIVWYVGSDRQEDREESP